MNRERLEAKDLPPKVRLLLFIVKDSITSYAITMQFITGQGKRAKKKKK